MDEQTELAYLAGFIDGEGCISINASGSLMFYVSQLDPVPLIMLRQRFGGNIRRIADKRGFRNMCMWQLVARRAMAALEELRPLLVVKGTQADIAIAFQKRKGGDGLLDDRETEIAERLAMKEQLSALKHVTYDHIELPPNEVRVPERHRGKALARVRKPKPLVQSRIPTADRSKPISKWGLGSHHRIVRPTPEALRLFYEEHGAKAAALEFGTSDQTIYNWLRKHEIPILGAKSEIVRERMSEAQRRSWQTGPRKPQGTVQPQTKP